MNTTAHRPGRKPGPFTSIPVRHGPAPVPDDRLMRRHRLARSVGTAAALGAGIGAGLATGSVTLGVFWALLAGYVVQMTSAPRISAVTRLVLAMAICGAAVGMLAVTVSQWGRSWFAIAVALAAAGLAGAAVAWLCRPVFTPPSLGADGRPVPAASPRSRSCASAG
jgi:hypothetical protein